VAAAGHNAVELPHGDDQMRRDLAAVLPTQAAGGGGAA